MAASALGAEPEPEEERTLPDESPDEAPCDPGEGKEPGDLEDDRSWSDPNAPTSDFPGEEDYDGRD